MKNALLIIATAALFFLDACKSKKNNYGRGEKNLATANAVHKAVESGDVSKLGDYIATDAVDHANPTGDVKGLEDIKTALAKFKEMSKDMKAEVIKEIGDNDYTFQVMRFTGTASTADMGMKPGEKYDMKSLHICKFKEGKIVEHWEYMQPADMMKMMPDSTKM